jgi:hypothetical protein
MVSILMVSKKVSGFLGFWLIDQVNSCLHDQHIHASDCRLAGTATTHFG